MNILLGFAPYIAFPVYAGGVNRSWLMSSVDCRPAKCGSKWARSGSPKVLELGTVLLFAALAVFTSAAHSKWTVMAVRLAVDAGLLAIVLALLAAGRPFTLQYARERVPEQYWHAPLFLTINRRIAWAWTGAFAAMVATHAAVVFVPAVPFWVDIVVTVAALAAAFRFTAWYPGHARKKAADVVVQAGHE